MQRSGKRLDTRSIDLGQIFVAAAEKYQERSDNVLAPGKYLLSNFSCVPLSSAGLAANAEKSWVECTKNVRDSVPLAQGHDPPY
jgi:hypothetical protein